MNESEGFVYQLSIQSSERKFVSNLKVLRTVICYMYLAYIAIGSIVLGYLESMTQVGELSATSLHHRILSYAFMWYSKSSEETGTELLKCVQGKINSRVAGGHVRLVVGDYSWNNLHSPIEPKDKGSKTWVVPSYQYGRKSWMYYSFDMSCGPVRACQLLCAVSVIWVSGHPRT
jgi:hypothetical protein